MELRSGRGSRGRARPAAAIAIALATGALWAAPGASAGEDPVAEGHFKLSLSDAFREQLRRNDVAMKPKAFDLGAGSSIDPVAGTGLLSLKGRLRFSHDGRSAVYTDLSARLGQGSYLRGYAKRRNGKRARKATKLFALGRGGVQRNGFGAEIRDVGVKLLRSAAKRLNRRLDLHSLRKVRAGSAKVSEQPKTVEAVGGTVQFFPDPDVDTASGTFASKLPAHCIKFDTGVSALAPAVESGPVNAPVFTFPVSGGSIGPQGNDGVVRQAGGVRLVNDRGPGSPYNGTNGFGTCPPTSGPGFGTTTVDQFDAGNDLLARTVLSHVAITGPAPPLGGDQGTSLTARLDMSRATVSADPVAMTVTIRGAVMRLGGGAAMSLNLAFPNRDPNQSLNFASGDLFGALNMTVDVR